jgi:predicted nucleic-acid-binding protein
MIAVDTNVLVRLLTGDDPEQQAIARLAFVSGQVWITKTVLMETGWVLNSLYKFEQTAIKDAFTKLLGLRNVRVESEAEVAAALALTDQGLELADALHLSCRPHGTFFVSFDKSSVKRAKRAGVPNVSTLAGPK